jgi:hypothetical protein
MAWLVHGNINVQPILSALCNESKKCVVISDAEFDRWGEAAERGDYGGSKGPVMHGPIFPVDADYPDIVSLGVSVDMLALVDAKVRRLGVMT